MKSFTEKVSKWVGKKVGIEGTTPLMVPGPKNQPQLVYSPAVGKLLEVYDDGVLIQEEGADAEHPTVYLFQNMRSITPADESRLIKPPPGILSA